VDDCPNVRLVDAHAEGNRGDDYFELARLEVSLHTLANARLKTCVIRGRPAAQHSGKLIGCLAGRRIDDRWAVLRFRKELHRELVPPRLRHLDYLDVQVVAAKSMDEEFGLPELQLRDDVFLHRRRRRGRESDDRCRPE